MSVGMVSQRNRMRLSMRAQPLSTLSPWKLPMHAMGQHCRR